MLYDAGMFNLLELSLLLAFNVNGICWYIEGSHEWLTKLEDCKAAVRFAVITSMITDRIGWEEVLLPIN